jgi:hypothetical protein
VVRGASAVDAAAEIPDRVVLKCNTCTEGRIVLTRKMIEKALR